MAKIFIPIALLLQLSIMVQGSPCSEYYTLYLNKLGTSEVLGRIEIPFPPRDVQYYLRVGFNTQPLIHGNGPIARIEIAQPTEGIIEALQIQQGRPLLYYVYFPVGQVIPRLTKIWLNDQQLCPNPEDTEYLRTTVVVEQMYPSGAEPLSLSSSSYQDSSIILNSSLTNYLSEGINKQIKILKRIRTKKFAQYNNNNINNNDSNNNNECGISNDNDDVNLMVAYGQQTSSERWPWLISLFVFKEEVYRFTCSGSILTTKHVITAAHCMSSVSNIHPNALVILGKFNLSQWQEQEVMKREIASYKIHPDYAHTTSGDSDLAILTLKIPIEFSPFIKPICLWSGPTNLQNVINRIGYIVGWGMNELGLFSEEPHMTGMPIVDQKTCLNSNKRFSILTSERTFCAGWRNDSGPCNGDSGSGLMLLNDTTNRYELRGLVSRSLRLRGDKLSCDLRNYVVYVDVAKYIPWIQEQISMENKSTSVEPSPQTNNYDECGISTYKEDINLLIGEGRNTLPGQWPWLAAIFTVEDYTKGYEFRCGGTILTTTHVLTAVSCLENKNIHSASPSIILDPRLLEVAMGRFNLRHIREEGTIIRKVKNYETHSYNYTSAIFGDSDLAILILRTPVEFNPFIRPICLWSGSTNLENIVQKKGYVVGWGEDEYGHPYTEQPRMAEMMITTKEECFGHRWFRGVSLSNFYFFNFTMKNIFYATIWKTRSIPCNGDSGSGLFFFDNTTSRYELRGIVSRPLLMYGNTFVRSSCNSKDCVIFVDVAKYIPWIQEIIFIENMKPTLLPQPTLQKIDNNNYNECGISQYREDINLLIAYGQDILPGQWPWVVALFVFRDVSWGTVNGDGLFKCAGTVLTTRHVLTAAHCLGKEYFPVYDFIHYSLFEIALGQFDLTHYSKEDTVTRDLTGYKIHPDYNLNGKSSDSDLAILILRIPVEFNRFIRPICLWSGSNTLQNVVARTGYVVGWGKDEDEQFTAKPRMVKAPIVSQETCRLSHENMSTFMSERTFCAGWRNDSGPCKNDDGSGLVLFNDTTNRYELRGIVSRTWFVPSSLRDKDRILPPPCLQNYVIYVDVAKYIPWIEEQISTESMMPTLAQLYAQINSKNKFYTFFKHSSTPLKFT